MQPSHPLTLIEFKILKESNSSMLIDLRHQNEFLKENIADSLFIGIEGPFDKWIQLLVPDKDTELLLILPEGKELDSYKRIIHLGYNKILGHLNKGISTWSNKYQTISFNSISANDFVIERNTKKINSIDIRKVSEYNDASIADVKLIPLSITKDFLQKFEAGTRYHLFCGGGYRSVIAISFLNKHGVTKLTNIEKGFSGIQEAIADSN